MFSSVSLTTRVWRNLRLFENGISPKAGGAAAPWKPSRTVPAHQCLHITLFPHHFIGLLLMWWCVPCIGTENTLKPCRCAPLLELHRGFWNCSFWGVPCWDYPTFAFPARLWEVWGRFLLDSGEGKDLCGLWLDLKSWGTEVWPNNLGRREGLYLNKLSRFEHSTTINY